MKDAIKAAIIGAVATIIGASISALVVLYPQSTDLPPYANSSNSVITTMNTPITITLNATDPEKKRLTFQIEEPPHHGPYNKSGNVVNYMPEEGFIGYDGFKYDARDHKGQSTGTVYVNINVYKKNTAAILFNNNGSNATDHVPIPLNQDIKTNVNEAVIFKLTGQYNDADKITPTIISKPIHGTLEETTQRSQFRYTPKLNYDGPDIIEFVLNNGKANSSIGYIKIDVVP